MWYFTLAKQSEFILSVDYFGGRIQKPYEFCYSIQIFIRNPKIGHSCSSLISAHGRARLSVNDNCNYLFADFQDVLWFSCVYDVTKVGHSPHYPLDTMNLNEIPECHTR